MIFQGPWIEDQNIIPAKEDPNNYVPIIAPADQTPVRVSGFQEQVQFWSTAKPDEQKAALLFASFMTTPEVAQRNIAAFGSPSAVVGVQPPEGHPIAAQMAKWLQGEVGLYLPTPPGAASGARERVLSGAGFGRARHFNPRSGLCADTKSRRCFQGHSHVSVARSLRARKCSPRGNTFL